MRWGSEAQCPGPDHRAVLSWTSLLCPKQLSKKKKCLLVFCVSCTDAKSLAEMLIRWVSELEVGGEARECWVVGVVLDPFNPGFSPHSVSDLLGFRPVKVIAASL